jgi:hypothetical protein
MVFRVILKSLAVGALPYETDRDAAAVGACTALDAGFASVGGVLAHLFPPSGALIIARSMASHFQLMPCNAW